MHPEICALFFLNSNPWGTGKLLNNNNHNFHFKFSLTQSPEARVDSAVLKTSQATGTFIWRYSCVSTYKWRSCLRAFGLRRWSTSGPLWSREKRHREPEIRWTGTVSPTAVHYRHPRHTRHYLHTEDFIHLRDTGCKKCSSWIGLNVHFPMNVYFIINSGNKLWS